ncbi:chaplin [Streptomyces sp. 549]|uniref:chaplin n=1 Tax=Streptomyces sp. 549 TaxID=3049076 RepID=UPI0024C3728E|nr:chaplin [Streptomyces sp. 549]MDK1473562.1 chaplin [Streptomyces sp. 549]
MRQVTKKGLISVAAAGGVLALSGGAAHAGSSADGAAQGSPGVLSGNNVQAPVHVPVNACGNTVNAVGLLNPAMGNNCVNKSSAPKGNKGGQDKGGNQGGGNQGGHQGGGHQGGGHQGGHQGGGHHGGGHHGGGAHADGHAGGSPGVGSGNNVQVPVDVPVNACGNSVTVVGGLNPAIGNECANTDTTPTKPRPGKPGAEQPGFEEPGSEQPGGEEKPEQPGTDEEPAQSGEGEKPRASGTDKAPERAAGSSQIEAQGVAGELAQTGGTMLGTAVPAGAALLLGGYVLYRRSKAAQH